LDSLATIPGKKEYGKPNKTLRGEVVRSQAERQIADYFFSNKIKYSYESQAKTNLSAVKDKISKPDFYLPDYDAYVEFWGLIDNC
jgi:DNA helicase IV